MIAIQNATIFSKGRRLDQGVVVVDGARIGAVRPAEAGLPEGVDQVLDASGLFLLPGFVELQINGGFGSDFTANPESIWPVAQKLPCFGVTSFLPTVVTSPLETVARAQAVLLGERPAGFKGARALGLHVEGPFLNRERKGAHKPEYLRRPSLADAANLSLENGVRLVTLAPELPGALDLVRALVQRGVVVSAGHSLATYAQALAAFDAGVSYGTHLFNAMPPFHQFEPGLVAALLTDPRVKFGLIADGIHVHPTLVSLVWKLSGPERLTLVTDAMGALGMPPGVYPLGGFEVIVDKTTARLPDGTLAGSLLSHDAALRNLIAFTGCSLEQALPTLTSTPAALLGLDREIGHIAPGYYADLVLMSPELQVVKTLVGGEVVYSA